jgi:O-antigen ligase
MFLVVLPLGMLAGVGLHRGTLNILNLLLCFAPFALIAAFQVRFMTVPEAMLFNVVTVFLWLTSYFVANYVADTPYEAVRRIMRAYLAIAVILAIVGALAYLGLMPGREFFLRFERAKATFNDPNVYGPFLIVPAMFALVRVLLDTGRRSWLAAAAVTIIAVGVFVSFSRAAWFHFVLSSVAVIVLCFIYEARALLRARILVMTALGALVLVAGLAAMLSIPEVADLFATRSSLEQSYDTGETGRFGRQAYALELALTHPMGLGPLQFRELRVIEDVHNTYVTVLLAYGWLGGLAYFALVAATLRRAIKYLGVPSPNRRLLIPLTAVLVALLIEAAIIDTDHWRHFFLVVGLIWGVTAGYRRVSPTQLAERSLV